MKKIYITVLFLIYSIISKNKSFIKILKEFSLVFNNPLIVSTVASVERRNLSSKFSIG